MYVRLAFAVAAHLESEILIVDEELAVGDAEFVKVLEKRQGFKISCIEEIAYKKGFINKEQLLATAEKYGKSGYGEYLKKLL